MEPTPGVEPILIMEPVNSILITARRLIKTLIISVMERYLIIEPIFVMGPTPFREPMLAKGSS
jgi:hypothetical protein